ncbi:hypothetical protein TNCV_570771 [Trichonephila clavipes]|nr:hypothetical protein TNCV_570771 [Trichonephila clavipes]
MSCSLHGSGSKLRGPSPIIFLLLYSTTLINTQSLQETVWGRRSLMNKVTDSWLVCHEFEPHTAEDPRCREGRCTLNLSRLTPTFRWCVGEVKRGGTGARSGIFLVS